MLRDIDRIKPDAVLFVDYPGFNLRLAKALRKRGYPGKNLYYVSPQVWAWNRGRIKKMAPILDLMICVFPFEQPMYEASGLHTVFTGHPLLEMLEAEQTHQPRETDLLGLFPGSREREVKRNFPAMLEACRIVRGKRPETRFELAAASESQAEQMHALAKDFPLTIRVGTAHDLMQRATAGIVCSGTATLEAAFFGLPYCLIYKAAWLTFQVGSRLVDVIVWASSTSSTTTSRIPRPTRTPGQGFAARGARVHPALCHPTGPGGGSTAAPFQREGAYRTHNESQCHCELSRCSRRE